MAPGALYEQRVGASGGYDLLRVSVTLVDGGRPAAISGYDRPETLSVQFNQACLLLVQPRPAHSRRWQHQGHRPLFSVFRFKSGAAKVNRYDKITSDQNCGASTAQIPLNVSGTHVSDFHV